MHYFLRTMYVLFRLNNHLCRAMDCLHCKPMFHHSIHHLATLKLNSVTAKRSVVGTLHYFIDLYISAFGEGCMRACLPSLGADQFDHEDPSESHQQSSFFNWYTFGISFGGFIGLILIVWLQNDKGWDIGFCVCSILILLGLLVFALGLPFYRNQIPEGSPLTRILTGCAPSYFI